MIPVIKNKRTFNVNYLEHMLHFENLHNVLNNGILSHNEAYNRNLIKKDISLSDVQIRRSARNISVGDLVVNVHDFVSFYFNSKNPMLYLRKNIQDELYVLLIDADILDCKVNDPIFAIFSDGNAGANLTKFYIGKDNLVNVDFELISGGSWNNEDLDVKKENKRKMCAEALVYPNLPVKNIKRIICPTRGMYDKALKLKSEIGKDVSHIEIEVNRDYYF